MKFCDGVVTDVDEFGCPHADTRFGVDERTEVRQEKGFFLKEGNGF